MGCRYRLAGERLIIENGRMLDLERLDIGGKFAMPIELTRNDAENCAAAQLAEVPLPFTRQPFHSKLSKRSRIFRISP